MSTASAPFDEVNSVVDCVVGTSLLEACVTSEVAKEVEPNVDESTFKAEIRQVFETFDYNKVLRDLDDGYFAAIGTIPDPKKDFLLAFGFLHRTKSENSFTTIITMWIIPEIRGILAHVRGRRNESGPDRRDDGSPSSYCHARVQSEIVEPHQPAIGVQRVTPPRVEIWRYTSRLWEEAQVHDQVPKVTNSHLSNFPTRFRVIVKFDGAQGEGEATSKKQAKHIASREVCRQLGIVL